MSDLQTADAILADIDDVIDRMGADEQIAELKRQVIELTRSNAELEAFAQIAGHDLRTPLRSIVQFSELLDRRYRETIDDDGR